MLGWSQDNVSYYCRLKKEPRPHAMMHLCRTFNCSVYDILGDATVIETMNDLSGRKRLRRKEGVGMVREVVVPFGAPDPWIAWGKQLRAAWEKPQNRARIELGVKSAWPNQAEEILSWLNQKG